MVKPKDETRTSSFGLTPRPGIRSIEEHCQSLEKSLRAGETIRCEDVFRSFPELATNADAALDLIYTEFVVRKELLQTPTHEEFLERFPQWRTQLDRQFQLANLFDETERSTDEARADTDPTPASSDRYRVIQLLARGGIGQVMRAMDTELNREVAVKEIQPKLDGVENIRERFLREAEITGRLEHPGVVPVYGLGEDKMGRPFYAMRLVRGESLLEAIETYHMNKHAKHDFRAFEFQKLLRRFLSVCETIAYAHSRGVIHRDIKPQNILLGPFGETLLVDWGLAKVIENDSASAMGDSVDRVRADSQTADSRWASHSVEFLTTQSAHWSIELTQAAGSLIGTPAFMSPEQARGDNPVVGPASDIYSLGATLHTLLTGRSRFADSNVNDTLQKILTGSFKRPREYDRAIPRSLEAICLKAMALEPAERYASASALADDIEHYLADEPVTAVPESTLSRFARWGRRNRKLAVAGLAALLLITFISAAAAVRIHGERLRADQQSIEAMRKAGRLAFDRGYQLMEQDQSGEGVLWLERALHHTPTQDSDMRRVILTNLSAARHHLLHRRAEFSHDRPLALSVFSEDGQYVMTAEHDGLTRIWNAETQERLAELSLKPARALAARFVGNNELLVAVTAETTIAFKRFPFKVPNDSPTNSLAERISTPTPVSTVEHSTNVAFATLNDDASLVAFSGRKPNTVRVCRVADGQLLSEIENPSLVQQLVFQRQSNWLAIVGANGLVKIWKPDAQTSEFAFVESFEKMVRVEFLPDGKTLLAGSESGSVGCWDLASKELVIDFGKPTGFISAVACSTDGKTIAAAWDHGVARAWNLEDRRPACEWLRFDRHTSSLSFRPHTHQMLINTRRESAVLWDLPSFETNIIALRQNTVDSVDFRSDGKVVAIASRNGTAQLRETAAGKLIGKPMKHRDGIKRICFRPDGELVLTASSDGTAKLWNAQSGKPHGKVMDHRINEKSRVAVASATFSPDSRFIATSDNLGFVRLWDADSGNPIREFEKGKGIGLSLCFSADGQRILVGYSSPDNGVRMWSTESGQLLWEVKQRATVRCVALSPNGKFALSGGNDETARIWNADNGKPVGDELMNRGEVFVAKFSPDSNLVVTGGYDATLRLWHTSTGLPFGEPMRHEALILDADFSADGTRLLTGSSDRTSRLWDVATCLPLASPLQHREIIASVKLSPTHDRAFAGRLWKIPHPLPDQPDSIRRWVRLATHRSFASGNNILWLDPTAIRNEAIEFQEIVGHLWQDWQDNF